MPVYHKNAALEWHPLSELYFKEGDPEAWGVITEGHWKEAPWDLFYAPPTVHYLESTDDAPLENVIIQSILDTAVADPLVPAIVVLKEGSVIGSKLAVTPALTTGDLSAYLRVIFLNYGEIQGAGGDPDGGAGGDAFVATSPLEFANYNFIRSGGGAGGLGGDAPGYDRNVNCTGSRYEKNYHGAADSGSSPSWVWHNSGEDNNLYLYFNSTSYIYTKGVNWNETYFDHGGFRYFRGGLWYHHKGTGSKLYAVHRCVHESVASLPGQHGGFGQGYEQEQTVGADKYGGEDPDEDKWRSEKIGGIGGDGGLWSKDGEAGSDGPNGAIGSDGGAGGLAIVGDINIHWLHNNNILGDIT